MDLDLRHLTGFIVIASGAVVVGLSYVAVYLMGKNAGRREIEERTATSGNAPRDRIDRIENAVDAIAVEIERIAEGQRFMLGSRASERRHPSPLPPPRRHSTPT